MSRDEIISDGTMRISEAVKLTGLSRSTLYKLMGNGTLPFCKIGVSMRDTRRIPRRALMQLLADSLCGVAVQ